MKLGVAGQLAHPDEPNAVLLPPDWRTIDVAAARRVRQAGFRGAQLFIHRPLEADLDDVRRVKRAFDAAGLEVAQVNGWYEPLCSYDDAVRAAGVRGMQALVRIGRMVNAPSVYVRPGGHNPNGHWYAHPENHSARTFDNIVDSLRRVCATAQDEGVTVAVEGHVLSALDTPQRVRDLLDAVGSPALKFNCDPVNFVGTVKQVHDTASVLNELYDLLGRDIVVAHAKDCRLADQLVVHIEEVVPGTGVLDYALFMRRFQAACPDGYFIVEHLPNALVPQARDFVQAVAHHHDIPLEC
ncbi:MAG: sugar phosphate isomerase/epimerase family protein [Anaerolineae bacterium]|nr:sugar phosphate isomerase/epimerase [Candidatus Roseilinea sp.]MDW8451297.1 sugar phosphate isomerase/epimerase family protein [Anaerolineae bacterium]